MHPNAIKPGDLIEVQVGSDNFEATVRTKTPKVVCIDPTNPIQWLYRYCHYKDVVRVVERPAADEAEVAA